MYVRICIYIFICIYVCIDVYYHSKIYDGGSHKYLPDICMYVCMYTHIRLCILVYMCVYSCSSTQTHLYTYTHAHKHSHMYEYIYICTTYIQMYTHKYTYIHTYMNMGIIASYIHIYMCFDITAPRESCVVPCPRHLLILFFVPVRFVLLHLRRHQRVIVGRPLHSQVAIVEIHRKSCTHFRLHLR